MSAALTLARLRIALAQAARDLADERAHFRDLAPLDARERRIAHYVKTVRLEGFENSYPSDLSGGMKQRLQVARAIEYCPAFGPPGCPCPVDKCGGWFASVPDVALGLREGQHVGVLHGRRLNTLRV